MDSPLNKETLVEDCCGGANGILGKTDRSEFWVDYVADVGDGWNSTYAIAYLIGQRSLKVTHDEKDLTLPRADCLIMGGDEVYPFADKDDYTRRMQVYLLGAFQFSHSKSI